MSKHTPGKWTAHLVPAHTMPDVPLPAEIRIDGRREISIYASPWSIANAHLIAAAPDLLEALEEAVQAIAQVGIQDHLVDYALCNRVSNKIADAIAKAKGEPK